MKKIVMIMLGCAVLTGCVDLDQKPMSSLTPETVEYDKNNLDAFGNGLTRELWHGNYGFNCRMQILGVGADDIVTGQLSKRYAFIDELATSSNMHDTDVETIWLGFYKLIRHANNMIVNIPSSTEETDEVKMPYVGEAYFMRAYAYFNLVRLFGDIPLVTDPNCLTDIYGNPIRSAVRASVEDVYTKVIIPDLEMAIDLLNNQSRTTAPSYDKDNSVPNKMAAKVCLAEVYLTMAGWPLKKTEYYTKAKEVAGEFITNNASNNNYKLVDHYEDLWKEATKASSDEHIFALNHSKEYMASNYGKSYFAMEEDANAWSDYLADSCFFERHPADERKTFNFVERFAIPGSPRRVNFKVTLMRSPGINKYRDYGGVGSAQSSGITPIYRYADVLLIYAEAQNMADGAPNELAYDCLNRIRQRAVGGGAYVKAENMDKATFAKAVSDERGWEFFAEFKRWFELVRTEQVYEANQYNPRVKAAMDKSGITPDNRTVYLMPIPVREIELLEIAGNGR